MSCLKKKSLLVYRFFLECSFANFCENRKKVFFSVSVTIHSARQWTIYAITRIIFPRTLTEGRGWKEGSRKTVQSGRKTIEVSGGGWVVLSRESRIVCREIVARWRIPDCERALLASGQKNRSEVAHAFGSVERMSEHFLTVRHWYLHTISLLLRFLCRTSSRVCARQTGKK